MSTITLFEDHKIRRSFHEDQWWFVITDIVAAFTESVDAAQYLKRLRRRDLSLAEAFKGGVQNVPPLSLPFDKPSGTADNYLGAAQKRKVLQADAPSPKK